MQKSTDSLVDICNLGMVYANFTNLTADRRPPTAMPENESRSAVRRLRSEL
jgi:hypothetical protein